MLLILMVSACNDPGPAAEKPAETTHPPEGRQGGGTTAPPVAPAPISEAPSGAPAAQGPADVVELYYALLAAGRYSEALRLRTDETPSAEALASEFRGHVELRVTAGAPGRIEGAAGSLYVDVPVQVFGRLGDGTSFRRSGSITLRRSNNVPGSTAEQLQWRIASIELGSGPE